MRFRKAIILEWESYKPQALDNVWAEIYRTVVSQFGPTVIAHETEWEPHEHGGLQEGRSENQGGGEDAYSPGTGGVSF